MPLDPQWILAGSGFFGACGYVFKAVVWEIVREHRNGNGRSESFPLGSKQLVNLVSLADVVEKLSEGQVKMMEAVTRMATIMEERLPSRRR